MSDRRLRYIFFVTVGIAAVGALFSSCSSSDESTEEPSYECDGYPHTNTVEAASWVRENTDIQSYRYESDPPEDIIALELLDDSEDSLGMLTIEGFFGSASDDKRQVNAVLERPGSEPLEVVSDAVISNDHAQEFRTRTQIRQGDAQVMVRADFQALDCYANEPSATGDGGHPCAWPVPVFQAPYSVPTCGFDVTPSLPAAPNLRALEYRIPVSGDPGMGGYLMTTDQGVASFEAVQSGGRVSDADDINAWLMASGADAIIGSDGEQLLSAAYVDPSWMDHIEDHAAECANQEAQSGLEVVRQPHSVQDFACEMGQSQQGLEAGAEEEIGTVRQPGGGKCGEDCADGCGKPHMRTFDGSSYPFHAAGEFILSHAEFGAPYMIQVRTEPAGQFSCRDEVEACQHITVITAIAMKIGDTQIGVYRDRQPHLVIDGESAERLASADLTGLPTGAQIHQRGEGRFRFDWPGGEALEVEVQEHHLDLHGILPVTRFGQVSGLWGNYTNITSDDFKLRSGEIMEKPYTFDEFYDDFAQSWRIDAGESLFDYDAGESTEGFNIMSLPEQDVSVDDLPNALRQDAEAACANVTGHPDRAWCIFDVVCMCDDEIAESTEHLGPHESITDMDPEAPITADGDMCLGAPESFAHREADEPACPPEVEACIHLVREQAGLVLASDLAVDASEVGIYSAEGDLEGSTVSEGTEVNAYLLHLNETHREAGILRGTAHFAHDIVGVLATTDGIAQTDAVLGQSEVPYEEGDRALSFDTDGFEILENGSSIRVDLQSHTGVTELRVVTRTTD